MLLSEGVRMRHARVTVAVRAAQETRKLTKSRTRTGNCRTPTPRERESTTPLVPLFTYPVPFLVAIAYSAAHVELAFIFLAVVLASRNAPQTCEEGEGARTRSCSTGGLPFFEVQVYFERLRISSRLTACLLPIAAGSHRAVKWTVLLHGRCNIRGAVHRKACRGVSGGSSGSRVGAATAPQTTTRACSVLARLRLQLSSLMPDTAPGQQGHSTRF